MKIVLLSIGKTRDDCVRHLMHSYFDRIRKMTSFEYIELPSVKHSARLPAEELKKKEGELIRNQISPGDMLVLLDEKGKLLTSREFSGFIESTAHASVKRLVFVIGGAYGFSGEVYKMARHKISLSPMTFSHQIVRILFAEQLYRALSIIRGLPYHHD